MRNTLRYLWQDETGQDLIEYALLVGIVSLGSVAALHAIGVAINGLLMNIAHQLAALGS